MSDSVVTKFMLDEAIAKQSRSIIDEVSSIIDIFASRIDERFNRLETQMEKVEASLDRLANTVDHLIARIDRYETEQTARDAEVRRIKDWIQQIATETGVKLKGFN